MDGFSLTQTSEPSSQPELTSDELEDLQVNFQAVEQNIGDFLNYVKEFIKHYNDNVPAAKYRVAEFLDENLIIPLHQLRMDLPETQKQASVRVANRVAYLRSLPQKSGKGKTKKRRSAVKKTRSSFHN